MIPKVKQLLTISLLTASKQQCQLHVGHIPMDLLVAANTLPFTA